MIHKMIAALALALATALPAQADAGPRLAYLPVLDEADGSSAQSLPYTARLAWSQPVELSVSESAGELIANYDQRVDDEAIAGFLSAAGDRLAGADWAYDTLVLRPAPGWLLAPRIAGNVLEVAFVPSVAVAEVVPAVPVPANTLLLARAELASGYPGRAHRRLVALAEAEPANREVMAALAEAELALGNPGLAARRMRDAGGDGEGDRSLEQAAARIERLAGPRFTAEAVIRDSRLFDQQEAALAAHVPLTYATTISGSVRVVASQADGIALAGASPVFADETAVLTELGASTAFSSTVRIAYAVSLLDGFEQVGAGIVAVLGPPEARLSAGLAWHQPDLVTPDGVLRGGSIDRATLGLGWRALPGLFVRADGAVLRYGAGEAFGQLETARAGGNMEYIARRAEPYLAFNYRLDGEYVLNARRTLGQTVYEPVATRENHTLDATVSMPIARQAVLTAVGGWTKDRFSGDGPVASVGLDVFPDGPWQVGVVGGISSVSRAGLGAEDYSYVNVGVTRRSGR